MTTPHTWKRIIAGTLLSSGVAMAGLGLAAGTVQADPGFIEPVGPYHRCLGAPPLDVNWDQGVCHTFWDVATGAGNVGGPGDLHRNLWEGPNPPRVGQGSLSRILCKSEVT